MKPNVIVRFTLLLIAAIVGTSLVQAQDLATLRDHMEKRLPAITALKDKQGVGETNRGYLEVRGGVSGNEQQVISEENSDRRKVYAALAAQTGSTADEVGRKRAEQIATLAKRGHWIQEPSGGWRQK